MTNNHTKQQIFYFQLGGVAAVHRPTTGGQVNIVFLTNKKFIYAGGDNWRGLRAKRKKNVC